MPEVVEVFLTSVYLNSKLKNKILTDIVVTGGRYKKNPIKNLKLLKENLPLKIKSVKTKGKFMFFNIDNEFYISNTFGLTGMWGFTKFNHSDVEFKIKGLGTLYFTDQMHYGTISITDDKEDIIKKLKKISPDFLQSNFTCSEFYDKIKSYPSQNEYIIKTLMKQQNSLGSGLGNYLASEILYDAKMSPYTKINNINKNESNKLCNSIKKVTKISYLYSDIGYFNHIDPELYNFIIKLRKKVVKNPKSEYNFHKSTKISNKKFKFNVYQQKYDPHGNEIEKSKIIPGRTTYWSPVIQK